MSTVGGYLEYRGGCSVPWRDIMMHVGDIMSTVEGVQYRGGKSQLLFEYPTVLNTHDIPHGTEHPPRYCTHIIQGDSCITV